MKIKFIRDYKVNDAEGQRFKVGEIRELTEASARHFITRMAAEEIVGSVEPPTPAEEVEAKPAPKRRGRRRKSVSDAEPVSVDPVEDTSNGSNGSDH